MAGDAYKKVARGQKITVSAEMWNRLVDLAAEHDMGRRGTDVPDLRRDVDKIKVKNSTGKDQARFAVLGLDVPLVLPSTSPDTLAEFKRVVAFNGVVPAVAIHTGRFCILQEPISKDQIGDALVSGLSPVQVTGTGSAADVTDADASQLTLGSGSTQVLWADNGSGTRWGVVRLGGPGLIAPRAALLTDHNSGQSIGPVGADVQFQTTVLDNGGWFPISNQYLTVPVAGDYCLSANLSLFYGVHSNTDYFALLIANRANGTVYGQGYGNLNLTAGAGGSVIAGAHADALVTLAAGTTIKLFASTGPLAGGGIVFQASFTAFKVG